MERVRPTRTAGQASSAGPQPKKIKTVSVRPDGSLISNAEVPPAVEKAAGAGSRDRRRETRFNHAGDSSQAKRHAARG